MTDAERIEQLETRVAKLQAYVDMRLKDICELGLFRLAERVRALEGQAPRQLEDVIQ